MERALRVVLRGVCLCHSNIDPCRYKFSISPLAGPIAARNGAWIGLKRFHPEPASVPLSIIISLLTCTKGAGCDPHTVGVRVRAPRRQATAGTKGAPRA
jgi:hypothetical protein